MKHAVVILAHKDFPLLYKLVEYFDKDCDVFIHVDKKSIFSPKEMEKLGKIRQVKAIFRKFSVHWGGFSMLRTELYMLSQAMGKSDACYFHLISGQDHPIKPLNDFLSFFAQANGKNYIEFHHLPYEHWDGCTYRRFQYYYMYDLVEGRSKKGQELITYFLKKQIQWHIKRSVPKHFDHLYGGSQWFSITRKAMLVLLNYTQKNPSFYRRMKYTFAPEETYVATILVNLLPKEEIVCDNLRFVRWMYENGGMPANLSAEHLKWFFLGNNLFVRKVTIQHSSTLIAAIDKYMLTEPRMEQSRTGVCKVNSLLPYTFDQSIGDAILRLYQLLDIETVLDAGCGAGLYVCYWRRYGMAVTGCDGNPHTLELSSLLLSANPCEVADLTEEIDEEEQEPFDMVVCLNVLQDIPMSYLDRVVSNLVYLSGKYLLIGWPEREQFTISDVVYESQNKMEFTKQKVASLGFASNRIGTNFLNMQITSTVKETFFLYQRKTFN